VTRPALEVADILRDHGAAWRQANRDHVSLAQLKVMSAIESCRTAALGGHVARCEDCAHTVVAYNSCRNRHCPKCQGAAAREWMEERQAELLPVPYFHSVYAKRPFAGPKAVLAYLSRYTHRVAISNSRLIAADATTVTFKLKDYRVEGPGRYTTMTLGAHEFIRRFLIHVLPKGFHRIRHYGLLAGGARDKRLAQARQLLQAAASTATDPEDEDEAAADEPTGSALATPCPCCGGRMIVFETFEAGCQPRHAQTIRIDTS
jgi:hypothetical protein